MISVRSKCLSSLPNTRLLLKASLSFFTGCFYRGPCNVIETVSPQMLCIEPFFWSWRLQQPPTPSCRWFLRMVDIDFRVALTTHALHCLQQTSPLLCCVRHVDLRLPRPSNMALAVPRISGLVRA